MNIPQDSWNAFEGDSYSVDAGGCIAFMIWNEFSGAIVTLLIVGEEEEEGNMFVCMYIYESREVKPMHLLLARERERDLSLK